MTKEILMDEILNEEELDAIAGGILFGDIGEVANKEVEIIKPPVVNPPIAARPF